jgi:hypothetical protein
MEAAIRAPTNTVREMPRRISPPTIRGEVNIPAMIILTRLWSVKQVEAGYCSGQEGNIQNESGPGGGTAIQAVTGSRRAMIAKVSRRAA